MRLTGKSRVLVSNTLKRSRSQLMGASQCVYSTPKYGANDVRVKTKVDATRAKLSTQKTSVESIRSGQ